MMDVTELEAMDMNAIARLDELNAGLAAGEFEDVGLAEAMVEAYESWRDGLWSFFTLAKKLGAF